MRATRVLLCQALCAFVALACADSSSSNPSSTALSPSGSVVTLTDGDFDARVLAPGAGDWFVEFYAPWCGHCQSMEGVWSELAQSLSSPDSADGSSPMHVAKLDATSELAQAKRFDIRGFPTLKLFVRDNGNSGAGTGQEGSSGDVKVVDYKGPRTLEALTRFARTRGGGGGGVNSSPVPSPPNAFEVALDRFVSLSGDVQTIFVRKPVAGVLLLTAGIALGMLGAGVLFAACLERNPPELLCYVDPRTGQKLTVPFVRRSPPPDSPMSPMSPMPDSSSGAEAEAEAHEQQQQPATSSNEGLQQRASKKQ